MSVSDFDMLLPLSKVLETPVSILLEEKVIESEADDLKAISAKLEVLNLQLAQRKRQEELFNMSSFCSWKYKSFYTLKDYVKKQCGIENKANMEIGIY